MSSKKVLIIEDNWEIRENTSEILELAGYSTETAENGKKGVQKAKEFAPDIIICDIMMPELDGYGVLNILSRNPDTSAIPFIFLTAKSEPTDIRKGMNLGADDYIVKPFDETDLLEAIEVRILRSQKLKVTEKNTDINELHDFINESKGISELSHLSEDRKEKQFDRKEAIYREGDYANYLYYLISGKVKCTKTDTYGKEFVTEVINPNSFFGYMTLMEDQEYFESAIAMEPCTVAIIPKSDFQSLVRNNRDVSMRFIKMLAGNVREKEEQLLQLAYSPVRERVADVLLKLSNINGEVNDKIEVLREDLASMVGTAKESLIRMLSEMKKDGLIDISGRQITIINRKELERINLGY